MEVDSQLLAFLRDEESRAYDATLLEEAETALNSYNGAAYGDEEEGRSQVVSRDVAEVTDYMLTSVLDAFVASGRVVEFEPANEGDEDVADDITEALHYIYRRKSGYRLIHDWAKGGLLEKIAVVKSCVERKRQRVERVVPDLLLAEDLAAQGIIEAEETGERDEMGNALWRVVSLEETAATFPDYYVPLEEFRIAPDARDLESAVYLAHVTEKSLSELVEMGFDAEGISEGDSPAYRVIARDDGRSPGLGDRQGANRKVWLNEEYVLYDLNGDGIAERLCVHRVGNTVLDIKEVDYQPFEYWCPFPMQGRLIGQSLFDKTGDIQRINTVLMRNGLDSLYSQVAPGHYVSDECQNEHTVDDLLTVRPNRLVRYTGAQPPIPETKQDVSQIAFQAIEFMVRQRESRTGITRLNRGVDEDTLNDTAKGQAQLMARGQQMERYIIRNFAEGVARLFMKKVGLMRRYGQPFRVRVDGEYRQVDPSQWPEDLEVQVVVGLGSGSKQDRIMFRQMIGQVQGMLMQSGSPIVTADNLYNNAAGLARDMNLPPNDLFTNPRDNPQQPQPDPEAMKAQAELQLKQQDLQAKQQEAALKLELERTKAEADAQLQREKAEFEREQALAQMMFERQLAQQKLEHERALAFYKADKDAEVRAKQYRDGGRLDA